MATTHYNRVIADGGVLPAGIVGLSSVLDSVITAYGVTTTADFNIQVPVFLDPHYTGYKLGAGSGTTLGQAAQKIYSISTRADVTQTTAASQPLLLAHSGVNYWWGSGVAGNYCSTPDNVANQITGDIEIIACAQMLTWTPGSLYMLVAKWNAGGSVVSYGLGITQTGLLNFVFSTSGTYQPANDKSSTTAVTFTDNQKGWVKVTFTASNSTIRFYTSIDGTTYTQLGSNISATGTSIYNSNQTLNIGQSNDSNFTFPLLGKIYRATISNSIGGAPVVDFNPNSYNASISQTAWTSATGEVWTINRSTGNELKGVIVNRTLMQTISTFNMSSSSANTFVTGNNVTYTEYIAAQQTQNQVQQSPARMSGLGSASVDIGTFSPLYFYNKDNAGTVRRFDPSSPVLTYLLSIYALVSNSTTTGYVNNVGGTGVSTAQSSTTINKIFIGLSANYNNFTGVVSSVILAATADGTTPRTAMYNVLKTMNNL
jgi:hypothetical protein